MKIMVTQWLQESKRCRKIAEEIFLTLVNIKEANGIGVKTHREIKAGRYFSTKIYEFENGDVLYLTENTECNDAVRLQEEVDYIITVECDADEINLYNMNLNGKEEQIFVRRGEGHQWKIY